MAHWYDDRHVVARVQAHLDWFGRTYLGTLPRITADGNLGGNTKNAILSAKYYLGYPDAQKLWGQAVDEDFINRLHHPTYKTNPVWIPRGIARRRVAARNWRVAHTGDWGSTLPGPLGWGGSRWVCAEAEPIARTHGAPITSQKRYQLIAGSSTASDHWYLNTRAFADDFGTFDGAGLARDVGKHFGFPFDPVGTFERHTVSRHGLNFSVQVLWAVPNHYNHVHVGCHRV